MAKVTKKRYNFTIRETTYDKLKEFCEKSGTWTMSSYIDVAVEKALKKEEG